MNSKMFKYVLWGALFAIPGGSILMGFLDRVSGPNRSGAVAVVNGYTVSQAEFRDKAFDIDQQIKYIRSKRGEYADFSLQMLGLAGNPLDIALSQLVYEKLLLGAAEQMGIHHISEDYATEKIADPFFAQQYLSSLIPAGVYNQLGELDNIALHKYLMRRGIALSDFESAVEDALKRVFALSLIPSAVYVPQATVKRSLLEQNNNREFTVLSFSLDNFVRQARSEGASEKELEDFFATQNKLFKRYWVPEHRTATVWEFAAEDYGIKVLEKEAKLHYNRNKEQFGNKKFESVRKEIEQQIKKEKFRNRFTADVRRYIAIGKGDEAALNKFIAKHKAQELTKTLDKKQEKSPLDYKVFELKAVGKMGSAADAEKGYLVRLDAVTLSYEPQLADVRKEVEDDFYRSRAQKAMKKALESSAQELTADNVKEVASANKAKARTISVASSNAERWSGLGKEGLPVGRMKKMTHPGFAINQMGPNNGYVVLLNAIESLESADSKDIQTAEAKRLKGDELQLFSTAFIASLQNNATIDYKNLQVTR